MSVRYPRNIKMLFDFALRDILVFRVRYLPKDLFSNLIDLDYVIFTFSAFLTFVLTLTGLWTLVFSLTTPHDNFNGNTCSIKTSKLIEQTRISYRKFNDSVIDIATLY